MDKLPGCPFSLFSFRFLLIRVAAGNQQYHSRTQTLWRIDTQPGGRACAVSHFSCLVDGWGGEVLPPRALVVIIGYIWPRSGLVFNRLGLYSIYTAMQGLSPHNTSDLHSVLPVEWNHMTVVSLTISIWSRLLVTDLRAGKLNLPPPERCLYILLRLSALSGFVIDHFYITLLCDDVCHWFAQT